SLWAADGNYHDPGKFRRNRRARFGIHAAGQPRSSSSTLEANYCGVNIGFIISARHPARPETLQPERHLKYRKLGHTDLEVSLIGLGTMTWGEQNTESEAHEQLDYALSRGVNVVDAAEMYP